jgi:hypothetical protein
VLAIYSPPNTRAKPVRYRYMDARSNGFFKKLTGQLNSKADLHFTKNELNGLSMAYHVHMYELQSTATGIIDKRLFCATR